MKRKECVAMILAGGQGSRLGSLTKKIAKPVVPFGGKYKIIDFTLSNCINSGIDTVGVLTQYQPHELSRYIGSGQPWDMDRYDGGIYILPPYLKGKSGEWYKGTANAIFQNISFVETFEPEDVLILSGDHIYIMDYQRMLEAHHEKGADATIAVITVPWEEADRFGIMEVDGQNRVVNFQEKPKKPVSNLASMGVYIFKWDMLREYLVKDEEDPKSSNDFGKNVIPEMLKDGAKLYAHEFADYWKDVGTIESLWQANMDLLQKPLKLDLYNDDMKIYCRNPVRPPHFAAAGAKIANSLVTEGSEIYGEVTNSVIFTGAVIAKGARVSNSVVFPDARIGQNCVVDKAIISEGAVLEDGAVINCNEPECPACQELAAREPTGFASEYCTGGVTLLAANITIGEGVHIQPNSMVEHSIPSAAAAKDATHAKKKGGKAQ